MGHGKHTLLSLFGVAFMACGGSPTAGDTLARSEPARLPSAQPDEPEETRVPEEGPVEEASRVDFSVLTSRPAPPDLPGAPSPTASGTPPPSLVRPFRSHRAFANRVYRNAMRFDRESRRRGRQGLAPYLRQETRNMARDYPAPGGRPPLSPTVALSTMTFSQVGVHGRYLLRMEGWDLVVRERVSATGAPLSDLPLVQTVQLGEPRRPSPRANAPGPTNFAIAGDRVFVSGDYGMRRFFQIDGSGRLTPSRSFELGGEGEWMVAGDEMLFTMNLPHARAQRYRQPTPLLSLPRVDLYDAGRAATVFPLDGREVSASRDARRRAREADLFMIGRCSFTHPNLQEACVGFAAFVPPEVIQSEMRHITNEAVYVLARDGSALYRFPWSGEPPTRLALPAGLPPDQGMHSVVWSGRDGRLAFVHGRDSAATPAWWPSGTGPRALLRLAPAQSSSPTHIGLPNYEEEGRYYGTGVFAGENWAEIEARTRLWVSRPGGPPRVHDMGGDIVGLAPVGDHLLVMSQRSQRAVIASVHIGDELTVVSEVEFPDAQAVNLRFVPEPGEARSGMLLLYLGSPGVPPRTTHSAFVAVEGLQLTVLPARGGAAAHGAVVFVPDQYLVEIPRQELLSLPRP